MVKPSSAAEVIYDPSLSHARQSRSRASAGEFQNFMSGSIGDMYQKPSRKPINQELDVENDELDIRKLMKDVEYIGSSSMSWKERKKLQNEKVVALGGKPTKKHRTPLSVAKPAMKNQKKREQREMEENLLLGRFIKRPKNNTTQKRRPEDRVLKSSIGNFSRGVLDVKDMLKPTPSKGLHGESRSSREGKKKGKRKGKGKGKKGKRKGR
ncbi:hypothetical protein IHE45_06G080000 [Dioscorea alata]|uniref:Uncharacterized protein n=1 Tax=Dioscorea alata TaxID=55571 RepID=A0ACB7VYP2_DIOAL|nr:hypothetical protein IHE45_06G080000 [Dioscorea alata]